MLFFIFLNVDSTEADLKENKEKVWENVIIYIIDKVFISDVVLNDDELSKTEESQYFLLLLWLTLNWCCVDIV